MFCAREAKKALGLEGDTQVELFLTPQKLPKFVQIRELPRVRSYVRELNLDIPEGVPYIESQVCNDIPGDLSLPAYVTMSQAGLKSILIGTGQYFMMGGDDGDDRAEEFQLLSNLAHNKDFLRLNTLPRQERFRGLEEILPYYNQVWSEGNELFDNYILICDKLDDTHAGMADVTTNKRAIITTLEAEKTSHAMTVARDLGIMAMGVDGNIRDMNYFYNQVETGDVVRMVSNGKKAVAYVDKR